jgi:hypothetical protein
MQSAPTKPLLVSLASGSCIKTLTAAISPKQKAKRFLRWRKRR